MSRCLRLKDELSVGRGDSKGRSRDEPKRIMRSLQETRSHRRLHVREWSEQPSRDSGLAVPSLEQSLARDG